MQASPGLEFVGEVREKMVLPNRHTYSLWVFSMEVGFGCGFGFVQGLFLGVVDYILNAFLLN